MRDTSFKKEIAAEAARWVVRLDDGELGEREREEFQRWLIADTRHAQEFNGHLVIAAMMSELSADPRFQLEPLAESPPPARRFGFAAKGLAAGAALAAALAVWFVLPPMQTPRLYEARTGQMRDVTFEDGSIAHLNTQTRLEWSGSERDRRVRLLAGEALFEVAHDAARPFLVTVGRGEIQALGTRFNVYRRQDGSVEVTVLEGRVRVREPGPGSGSAWERELGKDERIVYQATGLRRDVHRVAKTDIVRWRDGIIDVHRAPLPDVMQELSRYTDRRIEIRDPRIAQLRISGRLWVTRPDSTVIDLRRTFARIQKIAPVSVIYGKKTIDIVYDEHRVAPSPDSRE